MKKYNKILLSLILMLTFFFSLTFVQVKAVGARENQLYAIPTGITLTAYYDYYDTRVSITDTIGTTNNLYLWVINERINFAYNYEELDILNNVSWTDAIHFSIVSTVLKYDTIYLQYDGNIHEYNIYNETFFFTYNPSSHIMSIEEGSGLVSIIEDYEWDVLCNMSIWIVDTVYENLMDTDANYTEGYEDGHFIGYEDGFETGQQTGQQNIYNNGANAWGLLETNAWDYINGWNIGQSSGYTTGYNLGVLEVMDESLNIGTFIQVAADGVGGLLAVELLPNISLGMIVAVPLVFGLMAFVIGVSTGRKGGK